MALKIQSRMVASIALALGLMAMLLGTGCGAPVQSARASAPGVVVGSGKLVTREISQSDFTEVEIGNAAKLEVIPSDSYGVSITADDNLIDYVEVTRTGQTLRIGLKPGTSYNGTIQAKVSMPELRRLKLAGASNGTANGFSSAANLELELSGASRLASRVDAGDIRVALSGASNTTMTGSGKSLRLEASGASEASLGELSVDTASVTLSGASNATVSAQGRIDVNASGASTMVYGSGVLGRADTSGASSIRHR